MVADVTVVSWCIRGFVWCILIVDKYHWKQSYANIVLPKTPWPILMDECGRSNAIASSLSEETQALMYVYDSI